ncbi:MAG: acetoacetate metabolism regulatory protein AtoC [bacterium]|nr:MAG: acetoacetate metabolism regulatory protein AtoC [bacterium]
MVAYNAEESSSAITVNGNPISLLIVDDDDTVRETQESFFNMYGVKTECAGTGEEALEICAKTNFDVIITDFKMPGMSGLELLHRLNEKLVIETTEVIILTAYGSLESAKEATRAGAYNYLLKPIDMEKLLMEVENAATTSQLRRELYVLKHSDVQKAPAFFEFKSPRMRETMDHLQMAANSDSAILLLGESGVGKEVAANSVHSNSPRANNAFIKLHCAALSSGTLESELFGHEKGSFTGATRERKGRFELASGGTIFLDEISTISMSTQVKLLRVLQEKQLERVGGNKTISVDFRLITASNENLKDLIKSGRFRKDLYFRVGVIPIKIPSLRDMQDDIPKLSRFFIKGFCNTMGKKLISVSGDALRVLTGYSWPGNIRELQNVLERAVVLDKNGIIEKDDLPSELTKETGKAKLEIVGDQTLKIAVGEYEKLFILKTLERNGNNVTKSARKLNITRRNLQQKISRYQIKVR